MSELFPTGHQIVGQSKSLPDATDIRMAMMMMVMIGSLDSDTAGGRTESEVEKFVHYIIKCSEDKTGKSIHALVQILLLDVQGKVRMKLYVTKMHAVSVTHSLLYFYCINQDGCEREHGLKSVKNPKHFINAVLQKKNKNQLVSRKTVKALQLLCISKVYQMMVCAFRMHFQEMVVFCKKNENMNSTITILNSIAYQIVPGVCEGDMTAAYNAVELQNKVLLKHGYAFWVKYIIRKTVAVPLKDDNDEFVPPLVKRSSRNTCAGKKRKFDSGCDSVSSGLEDQYAYFADEQELLKKGQRDIVSSIEDMNRTLLSLLNMQVNIKTSLQDVVGTPLKTSKTPEQEKKPLSEEQKKKPPSSAIDLSNS